MFCSLVWQFCQEKMPTWSHNDRIIADLYACCICACHLLAMNFPVFISCMEHCHMIKNWTLIVKFDCLNANFFFDLLECSTNKFVLLFLGWKCFFFTRKYEKKQKRIWIDSTYFCEMQVHEICWQLQATKTHQNLCKIFFDAFRW